MSIDFNSYIQYEAFVGARLSLALDNTLDRLLIELQNIIESTVYGWKSPNSRPWGADMVGDVGLTSGHRTGQFYESWQANKSIIVGNMVVGEINQAIDVMQEMMLGGVLVHEDADNLAGIINSGVGYNFGQAEGVSRDYWNQWMTFVVANLDGILMEECAKLGVELQRV